jgi:transcriptional regulator with XRE-family HTH domain
MAREKRPSSFGRKLKVAREARGMSRRQLARAAGISDGYPSNLESGEIGEPGTAIARKLAAALGMTLDELLATPEASPRPRRGAAA